LPATGYSQGAKYSKGANTRERILRAAERQFAAHGYDGVSARRIAAAANVQLALLSYYFGSKLGLYRAVFQRRIDPISERRLDILRRVMRRVDPPPSIEEVLDALARPWVELRDEPGGEHYSRLIAREVGDPREGERGIVKQMLDTVALVFLGAMERTLPGLPRAEIHWAYYFFIGALLLVLANPKRMQRLSGDLCDADDSQAVISQIVDFSLKALKDRERVALRERKESSHEVGHLRSGRRKSAQRRLDRPRSKAG